MKKSTKLSAQTQLSLLGRYKGTKPRGGLPVYKFRKPGDSIVASFIRRRDGIHTHIDDDARTIDCDILECSDGKTHGEHSIFESTHLTSLFDEANLNKGDRFYLELFDINPESQFKRFSFELIDQDGQPPEDGDIPFPSE